MAKGKIDWGGFAEGALEEVISDIDAKADIKKKQLEAEQAMETFKAKEDYKSEQSIKQKKMESNIMSPYEKFMATQYQGENPDADMSMFPGMGTQGKQGQAAQEQPTAQGVGGQQEAQQDLASTYGQSKIGFGSKGFKPEIQDAKGILRELYDMEARGETLDTVNLKTKRSLEKKLMSIENKRREILGSKYEYSNIVKIDGMPTFVEPYVAEKPKKGGKTESDEDYMTRMEEEYGKANGTPKPEAAKAPKAAGKVDFKKQAMQELEEAGYPPTEANLAAVIKQIEAR